MTAYYMRISDCSSDVCSSDLVSAGGAVDLNDQFASSQLDIGKNGCAVLHGYHKSLPAFGRSWCPLLRHRRQPVPERVARRFQPLSRVQPANHAFADHALCQRNNDTVEHKVITEIGRASSRERVCTYVKISVASGYLK